MVFWLKLHYFIVLPAVSLLLVGPLIGYVLFTQSTWWKLHELQALVKKVPPTSIEAQRYRAMIAALQHGKTMYVFATNHAPPPIAAK